MFGINEVEREIGSRVQGPRSRRISSISIDSRTVQPGELFIPIKGEKFDGNKFIKDALAKGAFVVETKDGLTALHQLAAYHRSKFDLPVIAITGSVGKTTTKDMLASILSQAMPTLKNEQNYNNEIGVPLTLLKLTKKHKAAVIEMGMQGKGEIELLAKIARPTIAIVTNIGEAHLEQLGTKANIAKAKAEVFKFLKKEDWVVINADDEYYEHLVARVQGPGARVKTFGIIEKADIRTKELTGINLPLPGEHNIYNALAAIAVAKILKIKKPAIKKGLETFKPSSKRMEVINRPDGTKIINDTYNANPQSMAATLKVLAGIERPNVKRIAVLGSMLELGKRSKAAHAKIIKLAKQLKIDKVLTFGEFWPSLAPAEKTKKNLIKKLRQLIAPRDIILIKGSRGMRMEDVVDAIRT
ncbi:MAG: UDP-N-acetylmuramoyl-tripeptide--D-alanyl-D-alanine ligase [bacterium]